MTIEQLMEKADKLLDYSDPKKAQVLYEKALELLPEPKWEQELYLELMVAIGDALISQNKLGEAMKQFDRILKIPGADEIGLIHLRRGQIAYYNNKLDVAKTELVRALELGGEELFEDEHEEYYNFAMGIEEDEEE